MLSRIPSEYGYSLLVPCCVDLSLFVLLPTIGYMRRGRRAIGKPHRDRSGGWQISSRKCLSKNGGHSSDKHVAPHLMYVLTTSVRHIPARMRIRFAPCQTQPCEVQPHMYFTKVANRPSGDVDPRSYVVVGTSALRIQRSFSSPPRGVVDPDTLPAPDPNRNSRHRLRNGMQTDEHYVGSLEDSGGSRNSSNLDCEPQIHRD